MDDSIHFLVLVAFGVYGLGLVASRRVLRVLQGTFALASLCVSTYPRFPNPSDAEFDTVVGVWTFEVLVSWGACCSFSASL